MNIEDRELKKHVRRHWEEETCGTRYGESSDPKEYFREIAAARYLLEPQIEDFAGFDSAGGRKILEIGVGAGSDHLRWIKGGAIATGVDLSRSALGITRDNLAVNGIERSKIDLHQADAEHLPYIAGSFDIVYSWGVLHHTPDTARAFRETFRILRPGGILLSMIYHHPSWTGWMLWTRHALLRLRPFHSVRRVVFEELESPGTKAYTLREARDLIQGAGYVDIEMEVKLGPGDVLLTRPSNRYHGKTDVLAWRLYPRPIVRRVGKRFGIQLLIRARKPATVSR